MDSRLTALKALSGKSDLLEEFETFYRELMHDLSDKEDWASLKAARVVLHEQLDFVTGLALESDDRPPGMG